MLAHLISALIVLASPVTGVTEHDVAMLPAVTVIERRGFDPQTGAGSSIAVEETRGRLVDVGRLLGAEPGVTVRSAGGFFQSVGIRGGGANQHQLFINGVPLPSSLSAVISPSLLPLDALERIDIYRGTVPARFSRAPLSGGIDIITLDPRRAAPSVRLGAGSYGRIEAGAFSPFRIEQSSLLVGSGIRHWDGRFSYHDDNGTFGNRGDDRTAFRDNNDVSAADGFLTFETPLGEKLLRGHVISTGANSGLAGLGSNPASHARLDSRFFAAGSELVIPHALGTADLSIFGGHIRERFHDPRGELTVPGTNTLNAGEQIGARVGERFHIPLEPEIALEAEVLRYQTDTSARVLPSNRQQRAALSSGLRIDLGSLTLFPALQGEYNRISADDTIVAGTSTGAKSTERFLGAARLGGSFSVHPAVQLVANSGSGYRVPTTQEQFGDRGSQVGNPDLRPERAWFWDGGVQWRRQTPNAAWFLDLRVFQQSINDIIGVYQTTAKTASAVNFSKAEATGIEVSGNLAYRILHISANGVFNRIINRSEVASYHGKQLPGRPIWETNVSASLRTRYAAPFYGLSSQGGYFLDPVNSPARFVSERHYHTAGISVLPAAWLRITGSLENITDERSYDFIGYPLPGRAYSFVLQLQPTQGPL